MYANFGSESDFAFLADQGVDLNGSIVLTKYGRVGRGTRTVNGKKFGVAGVLVYSDPQNYALDGDTGVILTQIDTGILFCNFHVFRLP